VLLAWPPTAPLTIPPTPALCESASSEVVPSLHVYAAEATQLGTLLLMCVMAVAAVALSIVSVSQRWRASEAEPASSRTALAGVYLGGLGVTAGYVAFVLFCHRGGGFLMQLLDTLHGVGAYSSVRHRALAAKCVGEAAGFIVTTAMAGLVIITEANEKTVADRVLWLQRLLYAMSLLFVAGLLASQANFSMILAQWPGFADEGQKKAIDEVVASGTLQLGIAYSSLIAVFYIPMRVFLEVELQALLRKQKKGSGRSERKKLLVDNGVAVSWQEDAKQILALLAPVLASPLFDAIAKGK
jgi:hypothetical protein